MKFAPFLLLGVTDFLSDGSYKKNIIIYLLDNQSYVRC